MSAYLHCLTITSVTFPTYLKGHTFGLVLTKHYDTILQSIEPDFSLNVSDRYCVMCQLHLSCHSHQGTPLLLISVLLDMTFKPDFSTLHSSQPANSITFCCTSLTNMPQPPSTRSPPSLLCCGLLPWDHAFWTPSKNGGEQKGSGSSQDCRFINRFSMPLTNSLTVSYIRLTFCFIALRF